MSIVEGRGEAAPPTPSTGWLIAGAAIVAQYGFAQWLNRWAGSFAFRAAHAHAGLFYWSQASDVINFAYVWVALPALLIPRSFVSARARDPSWTRDPVWVRYRWVVVAVVLGLELISDLGMAQYASTGGYGTHTGAVWLDAHGEIARHDWTQARAVRITCDRGRSNYWVLTYQVSFADGRYARSELSHHQEDWMPQWVVNTADLDQQVNGSPAAAAADFRRVGDLEACLDGILRHIGPEEKAMLKAFVSPAHPDEGWDPVKTR